MAWQDERETGSRSGEEEPPAPWDELRESLSQWAERIDWRGRVGRHPLGAVAAALAVGYVLAGGFPSSLTRRVLAFGLRAGFRWMVVPAFQQEVGSLIRRGTGDGHAPEDEEPSHDERH